VADAKKSEIEAKQVADKKAKDLESAKESATNLETSCPLELEAAAKKEDEKKEDEKKEDDTKDSETEKSEDKDSSEAKDKEEKKTECAKKAKEASKNAEDVLKDAVKDGFNAAKPDIVEATRKKVATGAGLLTPQAETEAEVES